MIDPQGSDELLSTEGPPNGTAFFAQLDLAVNVLTIIIQCFFTGRLLRWL
jgi:hypothetical protein